MQKPAGAPFSSLFLVRRLVVHATSLTDSLTEFLFCEEPRMNWR